MIFFSHLPDWQIFKHLMTPTVANWETGFLLRTVDGSELEAHLWEDTLAVCRLATLNVHKLF